MFGSLLFQMDSLLGSDGWAAAAAAAGQALPMHPPAAARGPIAGGIADLGFLVGGVWVTEASGVAVAERVVWDTAHTCLLTQVTQTMGGRPVALARGTFGFSPARQYLMSNALSSSGTYTAGYQTGAPDAATWVFAMLCGSGGQVLDTQVTMRNPAPDTLVIAQALAQNGEWVPQSSATYHRQTLPHG